MILDGHAHVFLPHSDAYPRAVEVLAPASRSATIELLESTMEKAGVSGGVIVPLGLEDRYIAEILSGRRDRFAGVAVAEPGQTDPGLVAARLDRGGFDGLRLFGLASHNCPIQDHPWYPVLQRLSADGRKLWIYPALEDLPTVEEAVRALPEFRVVLNHCGLTQAGIGVDGSGRPRIDIRIPPPGLAAVESLGRYPNVYVMVSGQYAFSNEPYPYPDIAPVVQRLGSAFGADRLMWASDFPWILAEPGYRACVELVDHHLGGLSAAERASVLGGTCSRLFDLDPPPFP